MMEKRTKEKTKELKELLGKLSDVRYEMEKAIDIANKTSLCCLVSINDIAKEIDMAILVTKDHIKDGLLTEDVIWQPILN